MVWIAQKKKFAKDKLSSLIVLTFSDEAMSILLLLKFFLNRSLHGHHDIQPNYAQNNDIQRNDTQHNDIQ